jgi:hypothetical protein
MSTNTDADDTKLSEKIGVAERHTDIASSLPVGSTCVSTNNFIAVAGSDCSLPLSFQSHERGSDLECLIGTLSSSSLLHVPPSAAAETDIDNLTVNTTSCTFTDEH